MRQERGRFFSYDEIRIFRAQTHCKICGKMIDVTDVGPMIVVYKNAV